MNSAKLKQSLIDRAVVKNTQPLVPVKPFPEQDRFVEDQSQFIAALCTRRAGKTNGLALRFKRTMDRYPGSLSRYIALTRDSAKDIMWGVLQEMNENFRWQAKFKESNLTMTIPNGAKLRLYGADMKNFVRRLRGSKSPANAVDESQEFDPDHLANLVDDILTPTMADYEESWLALTGTPGPIPRGMFYKVTEEAWGEYSVHKWSLYENPYLPDPHAFVANLKKKKEWDDLNPTYRREYCGLWVIDREALLLPYDPAVNDYDKLPDDGAWEYVTGVDLGIRDSDALATIGWTDKAPNIYLIEETVTAGQGVTELANQVKEAVKKFDPYKLPTDEGALGKKIAEELRRRFDLPLMAADKARKMENAALLRDWMRQGKFKAKKDSRFAKDCQLVQIDYDKSTPDRLVLKKGYHSDIIDAVLYAFKESPAYDYKAPPPSKPKPGTPEWLREQEQAMLEQAEKSLQPDDDMWAGFGEDYTM